MGKLMEIITWGLIGIFVQNIVLSRAVSVSLTFYMPKRFKANFFFFGILTISTTASSILTWFVDEYAGRYRLITVARPFFFVLVIIMIYFMVVFFLARIKPDFYRQVRFWLPLSVFNAVVLGTPLLISRGEFTLVRAAGYGLGISVGFIIASLLVLIGIKRLKQLDLPAPFKGIAGELIYMGILSLGFAGFTGLIIPV